MPGTDLTCWIGDPPAVDSGALVADNRADTAARDLRQAPREEPIETFARAVVRRYKLMRIGGAVAGVGHRGSSIGLVMS